MNPDLKISNVRLGQQSCAMQNIKHLKAFTLLEILIAMSIAAVIGVAAFTLLDQATQAKNSIEHNGQRYNSIERAWMFISDDIQQLAPRKFRDEFGDKKDNLSSGDGLGSPHLNLTRMGRRNPAGLKRSNLERLSYFVEENILRRVSYNFPDGMITEQGLNRPLLKNVETIKFQFYDGESWFDYWPVSNVNVAPLSSNSASNGVNNNQTSNRVTLPVAVRITLDLADLGEVNRLFVISDAITDVSS